jgi:hypothetical protein
MAAQIRGALALLRGNDLLAITELERAAEGYTRTGSLLQAAAVRHRLGALRGGEGGAELRALARSSAVALGVRNPERWFRSLVPGFVD